MRLMICIKLILFCDSFDEHYKKESHIDGLNDSGEASDIDLMVTKLN